MNVTEHLYTCLAEEGSEIAKDCAKANRFGPNDREFPDGPTNREKLVDELNDLIGVTKLLVEMGELPVDWESVEKQAAKKSKVMKFMNYAASVGTLQTPETM